MSHPDTNPKTCENASDHFHARLDCAIRAAGMMPAQVAFIVGVNPSTLSRWLAGSSQPKARHIAALVRTTGCSAEWLVLGDGDGPVSVERFACPRAGPLSGGPGLTAKEAEALEALTHLHDARGICPTVREVAAEMGIRGSSQSWAYQLVTRLVAHGVARKDRGASRTLRPTPAGRAYLHAQRREAVGS